MGIPFTTASDAHSHVQLGEDFDRLGALLEECGIDEVAVYEKHRRAMLPWARA
jgi:histidinol-phosphatase (PHP family)